MNNVKVIEVSVNEDGEVSVNVSGLGDYKWFNYLMMDGGLVDEVEVEEVGELVEEWKKEVVVSLVDDVSKLDGIKEKVVEEVEKMIEELGGDCMLWKKFWSIEVDYSLSVVVSGFVE
jgi:NTP pyrophosphatase (non-canonical NTP hydrolase)